LYINAKEKLRIVLRGDGDPIFIPNARKVIRTVGRFLGVGFDYLVEREVGSSGGTQVVDEGLLQQIETYMAAFWKREAVAQKFSSNKRWGLIRGDAVFYLYGDLAKPGGERISIAEVDPHQVFLIEDDNDIGKLLGCHIVQRVRDFREKERQTTKQIAQRRTFRKVFDEDTGEFTGTITTELTHWELGAWDDRLDSFDPKKQVRSELYDEPETVMPAPISALPIYMWRNAPMQNSSYGTSELAGMETIFHAVNQAITDEDTTIVFQGLGMYVTNAKPPKGPDGQVTDWNVGPMQIIEIGAEQEFTRVSGVSDVSPYTNHMNWLDEKGIQEAGGIPATAIGRVDASVVASGIALKMELAPLLAENAEKEFELVTVLDQMLHDLVCMWFPAYEPELFGADELVASVVCVFDDPMPVDRDAKIQETLLLRTSNLILTSMAVAKLRELGWEYPPDMDDDSIAVALGEQAKEDADNAAGTLAGVGGDFGAGNEDFGGDFGGGQNGIEQPNSQTFSLTGQ